IGEVFWMSNRDQTQMLYISPAYEKVWGRTCASLYENPRSYMDAIHPDDRSRIAQFAATRRIESNFELEYRIVRPDGSLRWIRDLGFPIRDLTGQVTHVTGIALDITRLKVAEASLRHAHDNLEVQVANRTVELSRA